MLKGKTFDAKIIHQRFRLLNGGFRNPRKGKNNDQAHPPIHPTANPRDLNPQERQIFEFITRRFLACCSDDAKGQSTRISVELGGEIFHGTGLIVEQRNYLDVYTYDKWNTNEIIAAEVNEFIRPKSVLVKNGQTTAPPLLSEADLISTMDKNGIGTDATIHDHIKKVLDRSYAKQRPDRRFEPTPLGLGLVEGYDSFGLENSLTKPNLRSRTELDMRQVCDGSLSRETMVQNSLQLYREILRQAEENFVQLLEVFRRGPGLQPSGITRS